jgi:membrane-associated phospholipid phosphatase
MFPFERLAIVYFALFGVGALLSLPGRPRSSRAVLCALGAFVSVMAIARMSPAWIRLWLPHVYLVVGYWLPALLVGHFSAPAFETWLMQTDARFRRHIPPMPAWAVHLAELSYLMCYPALPAAFAVVWMFGTVVDAERFWIAVLTAGFLCYGTLPWLPSRPPRLLDDEAPRALAALNTAVLARVSHQLNTFPSGHVAVSVAAAASALTVWWPAGVAFGIVTVGIAVGAVIGRYHYVMDVLLGVVVGILAVLLW